MADAKKLDELADLLDAMAGLDSRHADLLELGDKVAAELAAEYRLLAMSMMAMSEAIRAGEYD